MTINYIYKNLKICNVLTWRNSIRNSKCPILLIKIIRSISMYFKGWRRETEFHWCPNKIERFQFNNWPIGCRSCQNRWSGTRWRCREQKDRKCRGSSCLWYNWNYGGEVTLTYFIVNYKDFCDKFSFDFIEK